MKRVPIIVLVAFLASLLIAALPASAGNGGNGNGAPSGPHYNLNIIGVDNPKNPPMDDTSRHTIFVPLTGRCNIDLQMGDYRVLDGNCFDGDGAAFRLPNPVDNAEDTTLNYSVWVRAVTPKGSAEFQTCFTDTFGDSWCNAGLLKVNISKVTPPKFTDVSKQLLQVCVGDQGATSGNLKPLFYDQALDYWWEYDNNGLRLAQMRLYPISTTLVGGACTREARQ